MTNQVSPESATLADLLDDCISVEICTVDKPTGQHTRHYLSDEQRAPLANLANGHAQTPREGLAAELMAFHDACSMDSAGGDGQFRILCSSGSTEQALALRAVLREAAAALS